MLIGPPPERNGHDARAKSTRHAGLQTERPAVVAYHDLIPVRYATRRSISCVQFEEWRAFKRAVLRQV
jgi:hypothetical protein